MRLNGLFALLVVYRVALMGRYGEVALDLLSGLLALDPKRRFTAREAMQHRFFETKPLPSIPGT